MRFGRLCKVFNSVFRMQKYSYGKLLVFHTSSPSLVAVLLMNGFFLFKKVNFWRNYKNFAIIKL
jgi:hypothetical protein